MPFFANTKQLYVCTEQLIYRIQEEDPKANDAMVAVRLIIQMRVSEPDGVIVLNGRSRPVTTSFSIDGLKPDLEISLSGDTLHQILLGELGLRQAMSQKLLRVNGPVFKAMVLAPLFSHTQRIYPQILREQGLA
ncbi:MAG: SCP2 sterol-binding domain-containing protein [Ardenticatenaceae bacterium]|nr:SCP2 sterol-binding domain-containing protein [Anaerolineales bacterium]MCB8920204.1 SCP2 sterol-binding domain-containing protein [Ardenticatenaceae bacterium]MCB9004877.1 SCP2 sterol-binding domain-containing protein [Ardenticatenaceae bacterium]